MKKYFLKSSLVLFGILVAISILLVIELSLRMKYPNYLSELSGDDMNYLNTFSDTLGWAQQKNYSHMLGNYMVRINGKGLRGQEVSYMKPRDTFRILMLGDSITFGYGVGDNQTFSRLLASKNKKLEVINAGVQGYGTDQELIYLQNEGLKYHPDLVVLNFCMMNDFIDNTRSKYFYDNTYPKPYFKIDNGRLVKYDENLKLNPFQELLFFLTEKSVLFSKILRALKINNLKFSQQLVKEYGIASNDSSVSEDAYITYRLIQEVKKTAELNRSAFLLAVFPGEENYNGDTKAFLDLANQINSWNIPTIYINQVLQEKGFGFDKYSQIASDNIMHLTPLGHRQVAELFYEYILKLPFFPLSGS